MRPDYQLDASSSEEARALWLQILRWILAPFRWLFEALEGLPDFLRWLVVIVLALVCVALIAHIVWSFVSALRGPRPSARRYGTTRTERETDPNDLVRQAELASGRGDYIEAVRLLFRAALARLERAENKPFRPGFTNRALMARYRSSPLAEPLARLVGVIDAKWYGDEICRDEDYAACRAEHDRLHALIREQGHAVGT
jgi:hypothetical protein